VPALKIFFINFLKFNYFSNFSQNIPSFAILLYTIIAVIVAYTIAWFNRNKGAVEAYCGRKVLNKFF
jgi:hypothetical protein